jgi:4-diphosphocytidyl-2C-methyl-D-erythritol kinase
LPNKTARLYAELVASDFSSGAQTEDAAASLGHGLTPAEDLLVNGFERAARTTFPGLDDLWASAEQAGERRFHLSGAGPALFALASDRADGDRLAGQLRPLGVPVRLAQSVRHARAVARPRFARVARIGYP